MNLGGIGHDDLEEAFWLSHLRIGFIVFIGQAVGIVVYLHGTPRGAHRGVLTAIAVASAGAALLSLVVVRKIAARPSRAAFSLTWVLTAGWLLALCIHLDGGLDSPLLYLVLIPVIYAALAFRPVAVVACGVCALLQLGAVAATDTHILLPRESLFMIAVAIAGMSILAMAASVYRARLQDRQAVLVLELAAYADTDGLTGCLNHRAFYERLAIEIDRAVRYDRPLALVLADIDEFKSVNDTFGHQAGDEALAAVGRALRRELRSADVAGRLGGDEFGILLTDTSLGGAEAHARRIGHSLELEGGRNVALSIGVACLDPADPSSPQLFRDADRALYHVKDTGRHGIAATPRSGTPTRLAS